MKNFKTSKEETLYFLMCEKAKQIQNYWNPRIGDSYKLSEDVWVIKDEKSLRYIKSIKENSTVKCIWIPNEEDIQEILYAPTMEKPINLLLRFVEWTKGYKGITDELINLPIKHLWLGYLMYHLYGMTWVGKDWKRLDYNKIQ